MRRACAWLAVALGVLWTTHAAAASPGLVLSLTLDQAEAIADRRNHDLAQARLATDAAKAGVTIAAAAPNPELSLQSTNINPHFGIGAGSPQNKTIDSVIGLSQLVERGGKRDLRVRNADALLAASAADFDDTARLTRITVCDSFFDLFAAQQRERIATELAQFADKSLSVAERRLKAGDLSASDLARVRIDSLRAQGDLRQARSDRDQAQIALAGVLGLDAGTGIEVVADWPDLRDGGDEIDLARQVNSRADVRAARARLDAAVAARDLAAAQRTRDITVGAQFEHYPASAANPSGSGNSFGVSLSIPLFTRYDFRGEVRAAEVALDSAREALAKVTDSASLELRARQSDLVLSADQVRSYRLELLPAEQHAIDASEFAFLHGATSVTDLLEARRTDRAIRLDAIAAELAHAKAAITWQILTNGSEHEHPQ